jgi:hypothetical protein
LTIIGTEIYLKRSMTMNKRDWFASCAAGLVLSLLLLYNGLPSSIIDPLPVRAEGKAGEAVRLMLRSHTTWQTVRGEITTQWLNTKNDNQIFYTTFEIENPNHANVDILAENGSSSLQWYGDGNIIYEINNRDKTYTATTQPDPTRVLSMIPIDLEEVDRETVYRHPLAMIIPSPAIDYVYPVGLAQRPGEYNLAGEESIAERKAWVIDYKNQNELGEVTMMARYWIDQQTGLILQANVFSTDPESFGDLIEITTFTSIAFDQPLELESFTPSVIGLEKADKQLPLVNP